VLDLGAAIAEALENAHRHGVLHRDLKPGNVMLTDDGQPKILDFGLAVLIAGGKATGRMTHSGTIVGSLPYMAPEQLFGEADDVRTDLYAMGAMLFEMATGQRPFIKSRPEALMFAIINNAAPAARSIRPDVPDELDRLLAQCLDKDPARRPASAALLAEALRRIREGKAAATPAPPASETIRAIAVLPLRNVSQDPAQEYFADGMTEAIISDLAHIRALRVISRTSAMRYKGTGLSIPEIAGELNVEAVLEGSALLVGNRVRLSVQLISARDDEMLWAARYDRELEDVLGLQSELAETVAHEIAIKLTPREATQLARRAAVNPEAHLEFLRSRHSYYAASPQAVEVGLRHARRAIELDPNLAPAWSALADCHAFRALRGMAPPAEAFAEGTAAAGAGSVAGGGARGAGRDPVAFGRPRGRAGRAQARHRAQSRPGARPRSAGPGALCLRAPSRGHRRDAQGGEPGSALDVHPHRRGRRALLCPRVREVGAALPDGARARPALRRRAHRSGPLARGAGPLRRGPGRV
jgi:TolB-like protein